MTLRPAERECDIHSDDILSADPDDRQANEAGLAFQP